MAASSITKNKTIREKPVKCKVMLCFRRLNVQVIFTVLPDTEKHNSSSKFQEPYSPSPPCPGGKPREKHLFSNNLCSLTAQIHPCCPSAWQSEAYSVCQGEHCSSPPAPCLLGISQASTGGLGAVMLLNTAISKCELKHIKPAFRRGAFWGGFF